MTRVLVTDYAWPDLDIERSILSQVGAEIVLPDGDEEPALVRAAAGCRAIVTNWAEVTAAVMDAAPGLAIVARLGVGLDNIDVAHATGRGVPVTNVPGYCTDEVAEHAIALLLASARNVGIYHHDTKSGRYDIGAGAPMRRVSGQTLGIVGFGAIGRATARRARGLGLRVLAASRTERDAEGVEWRSLDDLLAESDFVSLHAPLTDETRHLVGEGAFARMKPGAFLINTARGGLIDHAALARALERGRLAGAALDVQDPEPPPLGQPPYSDPRVIVTPHAAFVSEESLRELRTRAARQVAARLRGERPDHVVNVGVLGSRGAR